MRLVTIPGGENESALHVKDLAIVYGTTSDDAQMLADYIGLLFTNIVSRIVRLGPVLGIHAGPGALVTLVKEAR